MSETFCESFTFSDLGNIMVERQLRDMTAVEMLRAWAWHSDKANRICERETMPTDEEIASVEKAQRLGQLIKPPCRAGRTVCQLVRPRTGSGRSAAFSV